MKKLEKFSISEYTITKEIWDAVKVWAKEKGYSDLSVGCGKGKKPVGNITWFDAVKFSNALSEFVGLEPCYFVNGEVYRVGNCDEVEVKDTNGYRLPTASEWEYACRGGTDTVYFWGDEYVPMPKNEYGWCGIATEQCITHEVGLLKPNPYGIYDMAGNVHEWCFDKFKEYFRIMMGGSVAFDSIPRSDFRAFSSPEYFCYETGMRVVSSDLSAPDYEKKVRESKYFGCFEELKIQYPDLSEEALAKRLYKELGDTKEALYVKEAIDNPKEMLERFKCLFIKRLKECDVNAEIHYSGQDFDSMREDMLKLTFDNIRWYGKSGQRDAHHLIDKPTYLGLLYSKTGDERYWNKCMELYNSMLYRHKAEFDCLDDEMLIQRHQVEQSWGWNNGFEPASRAMGLLSAFWNAVNVGIDKELMPTKIVAGIALFIMCENMYTMLKDGRTTVFNQVCHVSREILKISMVYKDFRLAKTIKEIAEERLDEAFSGSTRKDGSPLEQSYMYNTAIPNTYYAVRDFIDNKATAEKLEKANKYVERYLTTATLPTGGLPALSTSAGTYPPDIKDEAAMEKHKENLTKLYNTGVWKNVDWCEKDRIVNAVITGSKDVPCFKNLHFPYGGISILRNGWEYKSQMVYFFSAPAGRGHAGMNINEIKVYDYGMPMLISMGGESYHINEYSPEDQHDYIRDIDAYHRNSLSHNTITAGKNQKRLLNGENNLKIDMENECGYKYYESEDLVFCEGKYSDGYLDSEAGEHKRQVIYDAENRLIFVFDTIGSRVEEEFIQSWNFMPKAFCETGIGFKDKKYSWGYEDSDIKIADNSIYTDSENAPNIYLYQFADCELNYERKRGELNPAAGWFAPEISSRRVPKTDIWTKWSAKGEKTILTVIATSEDRNSGIEEMKKVGSGCEFKKNGKKYSVSFTDEGNIDAKIGDSKIVVNQDGESYVEKAGIKNEIKAPTGFEWEDKDGYSRPVYVY